MVSAAKDLGTPAESGSPWVRAPEPAAQHVGTRCLQEMVQCPFQAFAAQRLIEDGEW